MEELQWFLGQLADFLRSYMDLWGRGVAALSREFDLGMSPAIADTVGFGLGSIILVAFVRRLAKWDRKGDKPQPFPLKTAETPAEVMSKDFEKLLMLLLKVAILILVLVVFVSTRG